MKTTLTDYLDKLRTCHDDERLRWELYVGDNYPIHLYGSEDLFSRVTSAFRNSPLSSLREPWHFFYEDEEALGFNYGLGTVQVYVRNGAVAIMKGRDMKINGQDPSVTLTVHPSQFSPNGKEMKGVSSYRALAIAIVVLGEYIIQEHLPAKFTKDVDLDITHIPK